ncbi:sulfonate transport system substrate-binding protein [Herbaspirillum sp. Sphag1AN]|uniref:ABC transporter substrate-binding protein n=1 Tax=unclassified Herbaspirillum TaxID=2624150 RepID=UPI00161DE8C1|nr:MULTISPECIES: ABC transporter substrate-binding protein [unclassified Herbaspirillum]MBB3213462.1 sulfonate transport system substrate-binding protein [Herbaspirillum sp. Sphag1AN]MBB3246494.1 sulfonate transport system substrate-binding protein [Herbaspirillum sp. Sphag64]
MHTGLRRWLLAATLILGSPMIAQAADQINGGMLRVGDQRQGARGILEASGLLKDLPYKIEWSDFPAAQPLGEALHAGAIDVGGLGDAPFIFALAAGAKAHVVSVSQTQSEGLAIVANSNSPLIDVASLKGHRIATTRGSIGHFLVLVALQKAGLKTSDVQLIFLNPSDAKAALATGAVDAWSTWDPYVAIAQLHDHAKVITNAVGLKDSFTYQAATDDAIARKRAILADYLQRLAQAQRWALNHPELVAQAQARITGLPPEVLTYVYKRAQLHPVAIDAKVIQSQQHTAAVYANAGVITQALDVSPSFDTSFKLK